MLAAKTFPTEYLDACRARIDDRVANAPDHPYAFHDLTLVLDRLFVHRQRGLEDKKGALRRLRDIADADPTTVTREEFVSLADDAFAELAERFA